MSRNKKSTHPLHHVCAIAVACCLVFSFGLHAVQVKHIHAHVDGTSQHNSHSDRESGVYVFGEYMHHADKKNVFGALALTVSLWTFLSTLYGVWGRLFRVVERHRLIFRKKSFIRYREPNYLVCLMESGILHTKIHYVALAQRV